MWVLNSTWRVSIPSFSKRANIAKFNFSNKATDGNLKTQTTCEFLNYELRIGITEFNYRKLNTYKNLG
ncbi:hypothetical protein NIES4073_45790 [Kalymmatonema gypsitolerans NIES-4073]|nr:hypothetical protein SAMD00079811_04990 [Scytonema sp. HK-05]BAZ23690.1 hypothetical protein NIES4073_45790 [Scytonema sp. NIES-4073]